MDKAIANMKPGVSWDYLILRAKGISAQERSDIIKELETLVQKSDGKFDIGIAEYSDERQAPLDVELSGDGAVVLYDAIEQLEAIGWRNDLRRGKARKGDGNMGFLNLRDTKHWKVIKQRLRRRGLKPVMDADDKGRTDWEIHGPHRDMDYQVYIGLAYEQDPDNRFYVVIYPRAVYELADSDWLRPEPENRIPVIK